MVHILVEEHFQKNTLTPDELHKIIIEFKNYCVEFKNYCVSHQRMRNRLTSSKRFDPTDFIENVNSYHLRMFHVGFKEVEKDKLESDFNLANDPSTFTFEIKVFDIDGKEVEYNFNGGKTFKKIKYKIRKSTERKGQTKRRRPTKRRKSKRRKTKRT